MKRMIVPLCLVLLACGCGKRDTKKDTPKKKPPQPSLTQTMIDGATGRTSVRQGRVARDKLIKIDEQRDKDLNEVLGQ